MKGIVITTKNEIRVEEFKKPQFKNLQKTVGGYVEIVRPRVQAPYQGFCFVCNEEGHIEGLDRNALGTILYGYESIVGNIVVLKEGYTSEGIDFVPMTEIEVNKTVTWLQALKDANIRR